MILSGIDTCDVPFIIGQAKSNINIKGQKSMMLDEIYGDLRNNPRWYVRKARPDRVKTVLIARVHGLSRDSR